MVDENGMPEKSKRSGIVSRNVWMLCDDDDIESLLKNTPIECLVSFLRLDRSCEIGGTVLLYYLVVESINPEEVLFVYV